VDFVDVKTGNKKRLNADQRALQKLITDRKINFIRIKVETSANQSTGGCGLPELPGIL
jgi:predicted Holliday junction resolvase-like endonuclease